LVVLPDNRTSRRRVEMHRATLDSVLPARTREVRRWSRDPGPAVAGIVFIRTSGGSRHRVAARAA
ncbi:MAG TPA: hypothetical protein VFL03_01175, partial [Candidatus Limnocylindrales bacterium]|nr:hypothetical protein [Candidatus Limnocylindrales bacterium]